MLVCHRALVWALMLYNIFTFDLPTPEDVLIVTYADDIPYLASNVFSIESSNKFLHILDMTLIERVLALRSQNRLLLLLEKITVHL